MSVKKFIVILFGVAMTLALFYSLNGCAPSIEKTQVQNVFVDVNGDGMQDLLLSGEVIINTGSANFPVQPTNSQP
jgi:hypothetical protein